MPCTCMYVCMYVCIHSCIYSLNLDLPFKTIDKINEIVKSWRQEWLQKNKKKKVYITNLGEPLFFGSFFLHKMKAYISLVESNLFFQKFFFISKSMSKCWIFLLTTTINKISLNFWLFWKYWYVRRRHINSKISTTFTMIFFPDK